MIGESVDALKGAILPLGLDCPLIAVTDGNVKDRLLRTFGHPDAIANNHDGLETIPYPLGGRREAQMGPRFPVSIATTISTASVASLPIVQTAQREQAWRDGRSLGGSIGRLRSGQALVVATFGRNKSTPTEIFVTQSCDE